MDLINKTLWLLFFGFLAMEIFPQGQSYISTNGSINNSFPKRSIYNVSNITPLKNNNSAEVLDSLICIYLNGIRIKITYNYNVDLSLNFFTMADWYNGEWIISDKRTNSYNSEGNLELVLWEWFNTSSGEWFKYAKDVYNYDSFGNRVVYLRLYFNGQEFENDFKYENFYDASNNLVSSVNYDWIDSIWTNSSKSIYTYTPENVIDTALFQIWTNNQWINYQLNIYEYDEELNIISNLAKRWQEDNWVNFGSGKFEYDVNNNLVLENWEIAYNNTWENWFRIFYEYGENNNLIHLFGEEWVNGQWILENEPLRVTNPDGILIGFIAKEIFLYYSRPTSVGSEKNIVEEYDLYQNYPNPFNPSTTIKYQIPNAGNVTLKVYDILGREVTILVDEFKNAGRYDVNFNAGELASGVYIYTIKSNDFTASKKLMLLK
ncbi:MAG TPA: T9SS type A sorting domain-containing protein [Ignavibacteriaceae bacterium]|nr:T9SS type A sorting domain-containing protein [Ignavibacteriaceae bacterium]